MRVATEVSIFFGVISDDREPDTVLCLLTEVEVVWRTALPAFCSVGERDEEDESFKSFGDFYTH